MFARLKRGHGGVPCCPKHRRDADRIDLRSASIGGSRCRSSSRRIFRRPSASRSVPGADGGDLHVGNRGEGFTMLFADHPSPRTACFSFFMGFEGRSDWRDQASKEEILRRSRRRAIGVRKLSTVRSTSEDGSRGPLRSRPPLRQGDEIDPEAPRSCRARLPCPRPLTRMFRPGRRCW